MLSLEIFYVTSYITNVVYESGAQAGGGLTRLLFEQRIRGIGRLAKYSYTLQ